jgi:predicted nucleotidyltransferase
VKGLVRRRAMDKKKKLQKLAKKCAEVLKDKYKVKKVSLIGSLVEGFVHERSDIDLVVEGLPPDLYMKVLTELWDILPAGVELNLIPFEDAFESLKEKVVKKGELVYE